MASSTRGSSSSSRHVLKVERGEKRRWKSAEEVSWHLGRVASGRIITIDKGTEFESSVPWWVPRFIFDRDDPLFLLAALVHDHLLEIEVYGWPQAAAEWYDAALASGAPRYKARLAYIGMAIYSVYRDPLKSTKATRA